MVSGSGTASVTFPAFPDGAWKLVAIDAILFNNSGSATGYNITVTPSGSIGGIVATPMGAFAKDEWTWTGGVIFPVNTSVVVAFNAAAVAGVQEILNAYAEPV